MDMRTVRRDMQSKGSRTEIITELRIFDIERFRLSTNLLGGFSEVLDIPLRDTLRGGKRL